MSEKIPNIKERITPKQERFPNSIEVAKTKLDKISDPNFCQYGVRYMNIDEYRDMIKLGRFKGEVSFDNFNFEDPSDIKSKPFLEKIRHISKVNGSERSPDFPYWEGVTRRRTKWDHNSRHIGKNRRYILEFKDIYDQEKNVIGDHNTDGHDLSPQKRAAMSFFLEHKQEAQSIIDIYKNLLIDFETNKKTILARGVSEIDFNALFITYNTYKGLKVDTFSETDISFVNEIFSKYQDIASVNDLDKAFSSIVKTKRTIDTNELNVAALEEIIESPELLYEKGGIRKLINGLTFESLHDTREDQNEQYHVAVYFDQKAIGEQDSFGMRNWRYLETPDKNPGDGILAVVSLIGEKELNED